MTIETEILKLLARKFKIDPIGLPESGLHFEINPDHDEIISKLNDLTSHDATWFDNNIVQPIIDEFETQIVDVIVDQFESGITTPIVTALLDPIVNNVIASFPNDIISPINDLFESWDPTEGITTWINNNFITLVQGYINNKNPRTVINNFLNLTINKFFKMFNINNPLYLELPEDELKFSFSIVNPLQLPTFKFGAIIYQLIRRMRNALITTLTSTADWYNTHVVGTSVYFPLPLLSGMGFKVAEKINNQWVFGSLSDWPEDASWEVMVGKLPFLNFGFPWDVNIPNTVISQSPMLWFNGTSWVYGPDYSKYYSMYDLLTDVIGYGMIILGIYLLSKAGMAIHAQKFSDNMLNGSMAQTINNAVITNQFVYNASVFANMASVLALINSLIGTTNNIVKLDSFLSNLGLPSIPDLDISALDLEPLKEDICDAIVANKDVLLAELSDMQNDHDEQDSDNSVVISKLQEALIKINAIGKRFY